MINIRINPVQRYPLVFISYEHITHTAIKAKKARRQIIINVFNYIYSSNIISRIKLQNLLN